MSRRAKKDKMSALVAAGLMPSSAALALETAAAAGQELPLPEEVTEHALVTDSDIIDNQTWWMHFAMKKKSRRRYARLLFSGPTTD